LDYQGVRNVADHEALSSDVSAWNGKGGEVDNEPSSEQA
jgi:hypothetical protein